MMHNPIKQMVIRIAVFLAVFGLLTLLISLTKLPYPWGWSAMLTMLFYKGVVRQII